MTESRLVVITSPSLGAVSGISTHVTLLEKALGHAYRFQHFQVGREGRQESTVQILARLLVSPFRLAALLRRCPAAIVHINTSMVPKAFWRDIWYLAVARAFRSAVIWQVHGGHLPDSYLRRSRLLRPLLRRILAAATVIVLISRAEYDAYREFLPRAPLELIPNAIEPGDLLAASPAKSMEARPLRLAYLGRLVTGKGVREALQAVGLLRDRGIVVAFTIAGAGPLGPSLQALVSQLGLEDRVTFSGPVFGPRKSELWRAADIFLFPTYAEGLPYALLEAMAACAVPVTTAVGGIPDVVRNGTDGLLVPPRDPAALADALQALDRSRERLAGMATAGRERILTGFSLPQLANGFARLYDAL